MASVIKRIADYNDGILPALKIIKWNALKESPFRFYRGTCHLFAEDFVKLYKYKPKIKTWICGDLHFENFGSYKGENRIVYFDLSDFDEAILASPEPEIARFLTSIIIGGWQMNITDDTLHSALQNILTAYITTIQKGKALMLEPQVAHGVFKTYFEQLEQFDRQSFIAKKTYKHKDALLLKPDNIHFMPVDEHTKTKVFAALEHLLHSNKRFQHIVFEDMAFRIAGTGSLGLERYCVLCRCKKSGKYYLIDVKEARKSCFTGLIEIKQPHFLNEADRVNSIAYLVQFNSPAFQATAHIDDKWYIVKELQRVDDKMALADFDNDFNRFAEVAEEMAVLMGYAHIRSGGHGGSATADDLIKFASKKQWQKEIVNVSWKLAEKNQKYYTEFVKLR